MCILRHSLSLRSTTEASHPHTLTHDDVCECLDVIVGTISLKLMNLSFVLVGPRRRLPLKCDIPSSLRPIIPFLELDRF